MLTSFCSLQPSLAYKDVCNSLRLDPDNTESLEMREDLETKALKYKNEVSNDPYLHLPFCASLCSFIMHLSSPFMSLSS